MPQQTDYILFTLNYIADLQVCLYEEYIVSTAHDRPTRDKTSGGVERGVG